VATNGPTLRPLTIAVASGKGGTGKTLVATNLAVMMAGAGLHVALVDCDVEAPNDHLFLLAEKTVVAESVVPVPLLDEQSCSLCGLCRDACRYGAIRLLGGSIHVFPELCHGCGQCVRECPDGALREEYRRVGEVARGSVREGLELVTGRLDIGEVKSPRVIEHARRVASDIASDVILVDAPPGVACAAVASTNGADALLLVTEPTVFGLHDLRLAVELGRGLGAPMGIVINRSEGAAGSTERYCATEGLAIVARIPFERRIAELYSEGRLVLDAHPQARQWFTDIRHGIERLASTGDVVERLASTGDAVGRSTSTGDVEECGS